MEICVDGVCFAYGRRRVLRGVDWVVGPGVTGLLGPNGSGKTTLLSVLIGLLRPSEGTVTVGGEATAGRSRTTRHRAGHGHGVRGDGPRAGGGRVGGGVRFGLVPQRWSVAGHMRVVDAVAYTAWVNGVPRGECVAAAGRAVAAVALADRAGDRVRSLSGGQRQRLGIAAGLVHDPEVLVLDEPTVGLDPGQRWRVRDMVAEIGRSRTVVLSSHLLDEVAQVCGRVGVLVAGRLVFDGTVAELEQLGTAPGRVGGVVGAGAGGVLGNGGDVGGVGGDRRSPIERGYERLLDGAGGVG